MAERNDSGEDFEDTGGERAAAPPATPEIPAKSGIKIEMKGDLPTVESPSISPAIADSGPEMTIDPAIADAIGRISVTPALDPAPKPHSRFTVKPRHKRYALLAASVAVAAALGGVVGAASTGGFSSEPRIDVAALEQKFEAALEQKREADKEMQQSIARLAKDTTALKANVEATNRLAHTQIAQIDEKIGAKVAAKVDERLKLASDEITGSISAPQTVEPAPSPAVATPLPVPRPAPRVAAAQSHPSPVRPPVVRGWSIHRVERGYVYVENYGDVYQIVPGAPLPGLGPVQSIKRLGGRWVVTTPKGIIVSSWDRRLFE